MLKLPQLVSVASGLNQEFAQTLARIKNRRASLKDQEITMHGTSFPLLSSRSKGAALAVNHSPGTELSMAMADQAKGLFQFMDLVIKNRKAIELKDLVKYTPPGDPLGIRLKNERFNFETGEGYKFELFNDIDALTDKVLQSTYSVISPEGEKFALYKNHDGKVVAESSTFGDEAPVLTMKAKDPGDSLGNIAEKPIEFSTYEPKED